MSSFPVNGYFKQLQDYYLARAEKAHSPAQANSTNDASGSEFPTDTIELSSDSIELARPVRPANDYCYLDTLTNSDKALVKAATGWDIDADPLGNTASAEAKDFVGRLNLDRSSGALNGEIDPSYIAKLIQENLTPQEGQVTVPVSVLYKVQAYLQQPSPSKP